MANILRISLSGAMARSKSPISSHDAYEKWDCTVLRDHRISASIFADVSASREREARGDVSAAATCEDDGDSAACEDDAAAWDGGRVAGGDGGKKATLAMGL